jgi:mRNA interferase MazF
MNRAEVWEVNLDPTIGAEIRKICPCVIVSRDALGRLPLKIVVPLTEWDSRYETAPWHIPIDSSPANGLAKKSSADTFQVRSVSQDRLVRRIGVLTEDTMVRIGQALKLCLALD